MSGEKQKPIFGKKVKPKIDFLNILTISILMVSHRQFQKVKPSERGPMEASGTVSHLASVFGCEIVKPKVKPIVKPLFYICKFLIFNFLHFPKIRHFIYWFQSFTFFPKKIGLKGKGKKAAKAGCLMSRKNVRTRKQKCPASQKKGKRGIGIEESSL